MMAADATTMRNSPEYIGDEIKLKLIRTDSGICKFSYFPVQLRGCDLSGLYNGATPVSPSKLARAESNLVRLSEAHPENLTVLTDLAAVYYRKENLEQSFSYASSAVQAGMECLKSSRFSTKRERLDGSCRENRPFLLAFLFAGKIKMEWGDAAGAVNFFERALQIDPADPCGARGFAMNACLHLDRPDKAFKIWEKHSRPDDLLLEILYGMPIVHLKLGNRIQADQAVKRAVGADPKTAVQLLRVKNAETGCPERSLYPSVKKAAAHYRRVMRDIWLATEGAMDLLRKHTF